MAKNEINGWLVVDKPAGLTSNQLLTEIKKILNPKKIGHSGTLDPFATGMLLVALGEATKTVDYAMDSGKVYEFEITWGEDRDTLDVDGKVVRASDKVPSEEELREVLTQFTGVISQMPPIYSALKVSGKRAYELAREGKEVELKERQVEIHSLKLLDFNNKSVRLEVGCGKGFYVRALARDICQKLGVCGYVSSLRRTANSCFKNNDMILLDYLRKVVHNADSLDLMRVVKPVYAVLDDILVQQVTQAEKDALRKGQAIKAERDALLVSAMFDNKVVALCSMKNGYLYPKRVFNY